MGGAVESARRRRSSRREVYDKVDQEKFLPIVTELDEKGDPYRPTFLKGRIYIDMSSEEKEASEYERLIRNIYGRPLHKKPVLGKPPAYLLEDRIAPSPTAHKLAQFKDAVLKERRHAHGLLADYFDALRDRFLAERIPEGGAPPSAIRGAGAATGYAVLHSESGADGSWRNAAVYVL